MLMLFVSEVVQGFAVFGLARLWSVSSRSKRRATVSLEFRSYKKTLEETIHLWQYLCTQISPEKKFFLPNTTITYPPSFTLTLSTIHPLRFLCPHPSHLNLQFFLMSQFRWEQVQHVMSYSIIVRLVLV